MESREFANFGHSDARLFTTEAQRSQRKAGWFYPIEREPDWKKDAALRGKIGSRTNP
jgi:hypothetical protein